MAAPPGAWKESGGLRVAKADQRAYTLLTLGNGLRAVVVSDPSATQAAAALEVTVGSFSDPLNLPGLAHFLEVGVRVWGR